MKIFNILLTVLIVLLSIAAGLAKMMQVPQEVEFLMEFGLTSFMIIFFGALQIIGGILTALAKTRMSGAVLVLLGFLVSAILVFLSGNLLFGLISFIPVIITFFILYQSSKAWLDNKANKV